MFKKCDNVRTMAIYVNDHETLKCHFLFKVAWMSTERNRAERLFQVKFGNENHLGPAWLANQFLKELIKQLHLGCPVWFLTSHDAKLTWRGRWRLPTTNIAPPRRRLGGRRPICKILTMPKRRKHPITGRRRRRRGEESCGVVEVVERQTISGQPRRRRKEEDEVRWHPKRRYGDEPIPSSLRISTNQLIIVSPKHNPPFLLVALFIHAP